MPGLSIIPSASVLERIPSLAREFSQRRRVTVDGLLPPEVIEPIARELQALPFERSENTPLCGGRKDSPRHWYFSFRVVADPHTNGSPLRAFVHSVARGPIRDLIVAITGLSRLRDRSWKGRPALAANAFPRGAFVEPHADSLFDRIGTVFHASTHWQPEWGGALHFTNDPTDTYFPTFGALNVFELGPRNRHEVTMITGPEIRYTIIGRHFEERP